MDGLSQIVRKNLPEMYADDKRKQDAYYARDEKKTKKPAQPTDRKGARTTGETSTRY